MKSRRNFIKMSGLLAAGGVFIRSRSLFTGMDFTSKRPPLGDRRFTSEAVEAVIRQVKASLPDTELGWLFENCFPNTLDTTVFFERSNDKPDTYVITGDIDAMWLRDSSAQIWPYIPLTIKDEPLKQLIAGVIHRQVKCILKDPYANAFYKDENKVSEWKSDLTTMKPGIHERKWEIDSLCYPIRIAYKYWETTRDTTPFDAAWKESIRLTLQTFREQQRKHDLGSYTFQRTTSWATDGVPLSGYGYPVKPVGLICSMFRASDDATIYPLHVPDNLFAVTSLRQAAKMVGMISKDANLANDCNALADEVHKALLQHAIVVHPKFGKVYAYEVNGFGSFNLMDDANSPGLLSLPSLGAIDRKDPVYQQTRRLVLSDENPFFFTGTAGEGIGSPHSGLNMIWPIGIINRALTADNSQEINKAIKTLIHSHAGTGFMHESFNKDDASTFTRKWFAWANTLFGQMIWQVHQTQPHLLQQI